MHSLLPHFSDRCMVVGRYVYGLVPDSQWGSNPDDLMPLFASAPDKIFAEDEDRAGVSICYLVPLYIY